MADRSVSVELRLKAAGYLAGLQAAKQATRDLANETLKATKQNHANLQQVGRAGLIAGGAIAAGLGAAVLAAARFDKSLSGVKAVAGATGAEMGRLRQAALDAGRATVFSASESADAEAELAKAGVSVKDILGGGLTGALSLAAAGQIELADAATIAAQAMNVFKLKGSDVGHVADVLAAGANKSAADVGQLGEALRQGGLLAAQTGLSLEDTVGALSAFADNALIGSDAGTSLKTMLQRLVPQGEKAQSAMDSIGFSAYDAAGNFVGLQSVAEQLQKGLGTLSAEQRAATLNIIFGSDAVRAANVLYDEGAAGIADYVGAVDDAGAASRMAAIQLDNLAGDFEQLKGSVETALIQTGSAGNDSLRSLTQTATGAVNSFSGLPGPVQKTGFYMGALTSATLLTVGAVGTLLPKVRETRAALIGMGAAGQIANRGLGLVGKAGAVGATLAAIAIAADQVSKKMRELEGNGPPAVDKMTASLVKLGDTGDLSGLALKTIGEDAKQLSHDLGKSDSGLSQFNSGLAKFSSFGLGTTGLTAAKDRIDAIDKSLASLVGQGYETQAAAIFTAISGDLSASEVDDLRSKLDDYAGSLETADSQATLAAGSSDQLAGALGDVKDEAFDAEAALKDYETRLTDTSAIDAYTANASLAKSFKELSKDIKTAGAVTNAEKITLGGYATDVKTAADAVLNNSLKTKGLRESQKDANDALREGRKHFIDLAEQAGYGAKQAQRLADRLIEIPERTAPQVDTSSIEDALAKTRKLVRLLERLGVSRSTAQGTANRLDARGFASGGFIPGPPSRADTVPAMLSTGEFVVNAASTSVNRGLLEAINSGQRFADGGIVRGGPTYSSGGGNTGVRVDHISVVAPDPVSAAHLTVSSLSDEVWKRGGWGPA